MANDELYDAVIQALDDLFGDESVASSVTRENLEELRGQIDTMLETLA